jgi:hypothetical protein
LKEDQFPALEGSSIKSLDESLTSTECKSITLEHGAKPKDDSLENKSVSKKKYAEALMQKPAADDSQSEK